MNYKSCIVLCALCIALCGCHTTKQVVTTPTTTQSSTSTTADTLATRLNAFAAAQRGWTTLQASGNVKVAGAKTFSSAMQMRMERGKAVYISLRPLMGVEIGKIVITRDSVLVVDKYHKRYLAEPISLITNGIPVTVTEMQDILLGRAFVLGNGSVNTGSKHLVDLAANGQGYRLTPKAQPEAFTYGFTLDPNNHVLAIDVTPTRGEKTPYTAHYSDVQQTLAGTIAHHADVTATVGKGKFTLSLDINNITWNNQVTIDHSKPGANYQRMEGRQITSILGQ